jgi:hypothetical protein
VSCLTAREEGNLQKKLISISAGGSARFSRYSFKVDMMDEIEEHERQMIISTMLVCMKDNRNTNQEIYVIC